MIHSVCQTSTKCFDALSVIKQRCSYRGGGGPSLNFLDKLTLFKPGGQIMPLTLLPAPPEIKKLSTPLPLHSKKEKLEPIFVLVHVVSLARRLQPFLYLILSLSSSKLTVGVLKAFCSIWPISSFLFPFFPLLPFFLQNATKEEIKQL